MMERWKIILLAFVICFTGLAIYDGNPTSCAITYKNGGAPAILQSPKCRHLAISNKFSVNQTGANCFWGTGTRQMYKISPEDQVICDLNMEIPFYGKNSSNDARFGMVAVFDEHEHEKISSVATRFVKELFLVHLYFTWDEMQTSDHSCREAPCKKEEPMLQNTTGKRFLLREALLRTVGDLSSTFSGGIGPNNLVLGCPNIVILVEDQVLMVNACSSRPFICYGEPRPPSKSGDDEEVERGGTGVPLGFPKWCVSLRSDDRLVPLVYHNTSSLQVKRYGEVGSEAVMEWQRLKVFDRFLVMSSGGISGQDPCHFTRHHCIHRECLYPAPYADCVWSMRLFTPNPHDVALVVVPLKSAN